MSDLIDRKAAISAVWPAYQKAQETDVSDFKKTLMVIDAIQTTLTTMPPAELAWISATERKPEIPCLACDANGNVFIPQGIITLKTEDRTFYLDGKYYSIALDDCMVDGETTNFLIYENRIIAWMPLPEPYNRDEARGE